MTPPRTIADSGTCIWRNAQIDFVYTSFECGLETVTPRFFPAVVSLSATKIGIPCRAQGPEAALP